MIGRFRLKEEAWAVDWEASLGMLYRTPEPAAVDVLYQPAPIFEIQKDGSFRIEDVPPGPYQVGLSGFYQTRKLAGDCV